MNNKIILLNTPLTDHISQDRLCDHFEYIYKVLKIKNLEDAIHIGNLTKEFVVKHFIKSFEEILDFKYGQDFDITVHFKNPAEINTERGLIPQFIALLDGKTKWIKSINADSKIYNYFASSAREGVKETFDTLSAFPIKDENQTSIGCISIISKSIQEDKYNNTKYALQNIIFKITELLQPTAEYINKMYKDDEKILHYLQTTKAQRKGTRHGVKGFISDIQTRAKRIKDISNELISLFLKKNDLSTINYEFFDWLFTKIIEASKKGNLEKSTLKNILLSTKLNIISKDFYENINKLIMEINRNAEGARLKSNNIVEFINEQLPPEESLVQINLKNVIEDILKSRSSEFFKLNTSQPCLINSNYDLEHISLFNYEAKIRIIIDNMILNAIQSCFEKKYGNATKIVATLHDQIKAKEEDIEMLFEKSSELEKYDIHSIYRWKESVTNLLINNFIEKYEIPIQTKEIDLIKLKGEWDYWKSNLYDEIYAPHIDIEIRLVENNTEVEVKIIDNGYGTKEKRSPIPGKGEGIKINKQLAKACHAEYHEAKDRNDSTQGASTKIRLKLQKENLLKFGIKGQYSLAGAIVKRAPALSNFLNYYDDKIEYIFYHRNANTFQKYINRNNHHGPTDNEITDITNENEINTLYTIAQDALHFLEQEQSVWTYVKLNDQLYPVIEMTNNNLYILRGLTDKKINNSDKFTEQIAALYEKFKNHYQNWEEFITTINKINYMLFLEGKINELNRYITKEIIMNKKENKIYHVISFSSIQKKTEAKVTTYVKHYAEEGSKDYKIIPYQFSLAQENNVFTFSSRKIFEKYYKSQILNEDECSLNKNDNISGIIHIDKSDSTKDGERFYFGINYKNILNMKGRIESINNLCQQLLTCNAITSDANQIINKTNDLFNSYASEKNNKRFDEILNHYTNTTLGIIGDIEMGKLSPVDTENLSRIKGNIRGLNNKNITMIKIPASEILQIINFDKNIYTNIMNNEKIIKNLIMKNELTNIFANDSDSIKIINNYNKDKKFHKFTQDINKALNQETYSNKLKELLINKLISEQFSLWTHSWAKGADFLRTKNVWLQYIKNEQSFVGLFNNLNPDHKTFNYRLYLITNDFSHIIKLKIGDEFKM
ncbi:hypothetical protein ACFL56_02595 [Candidatus Margulisiibacteriota bacterium]